MNTVKEAANSLLQKKEVTQEEYNHLEKMGAFKITTPWLKKFVGWQPLKTTGEILTSAGEGVKKVWPLAGLVGAGLVAKELILDPIIANKKMEESYGQMINKTPQLAGEDQEKIRDYFNVVKTFAPHAAANPLVAGSLVNKMMTWGGVDHKLVQDMVALQEGHVGEGIVPRVIEGAAKSLTGVQKKD